MDDETKMNAITERLIQAAIEVLWISEFDAFSIPNETDRRILFTLYKIKSPNNNSKEWTIRDLTTKSIGNFNDIHQSIYGKLRPKGFLITEKRKGSGNSVFIWLTEYGEKFVYQVESGLSKEYVDITVKKCLKPINQNFDSKEEINFIVKAKQWKQKKHNSLTQTKAN